MVVLCHRIIGVSNSCFAHSWYHWCKVRFHRSLKSHDLEVIGSDKLLCDLLRCLHPKSLTWPCKQQRWSPILSHNAYLQTPHGCTTIDQCGVGLWFNEVPHVAVYDFQQRDFAPESSSSPKSLGQVKWYDLCIRQAWKYSCDLICFFLFTKASR